MGGVYGPIEVEEVGAAVLVVVFAGDSADDVVEFAGGAEVTVLMAVVGDDGAAAVVVVAPPHPVAAGAITRTISAVTAKDVVKPPVPRTLLRMPTFAPPRDGRAPMAGLGVTIQAGPSGRQ
jgi:hypothetical protein